MWGGLLNQPSLIHEFHIKFKKMTDINVVFSSSSSSAKAIVHTRRKGLKMKITDFDSEGGKTSRQSVMATGSKSSEVIKQQHV